MAGAAPSTLAAFSKLITRTYLHHTRVLPLVFTRSFSNKSIADSGDVSRDLTDKDTKDRYRSEIDALLSQSSHSNTQFKRKSKYFMKVYGETQSADVTEGSFHTGGKAAMTVSKQVKDLRDPNERIEELMPEDVEEKIDGRLKIPLSRNGRKGKHAFEYERKIWRLANRGMIKEALAIFEEDMMVRDRVMPRRKTFDILLGRLAHTGHMNKCFQLFTKMKHLNLDPTDKCYTNLFNSCANHYDKPAALSRATTLLNYMSENGVQSNIFTLKASMKAFAVCGDLPTAFALMDDASSRMNLDAECFNHLLMACISEKSSGFHRSIQVFLKMKQFNIKPEKSTIHLLIRCARDCGVGSPKDYINTFKLPATDEKTAGRLSADEENTAGRLSTTSSARSNLAVENLGDTSRDLAEVSEVRPPTLVVRTLADLKRPDGRLALLGGPVKLLDLMDELSLPPDVVTFTQLLACLPNSLSWELWLLQQMEERRCRPDVDFLNDVMIRRTKRDKGSVKNVLPLMSRLKLQPNMRTYGALALTCDTEDQALQLIDDMKSVNLEPNTVVMGKLIAASGFKFSQKRRMLMLMEEMGLQPNIKTITVIEKTLLEVKKKIVEAERSDPDSVMLSDSFQIPFRNFNNYYQQWLQKTDLNRRKDPWQSLDVTPEL